MNYGYEDCLFDPYTNYENGFEGDLEVDEGYGFSSFNRSKDYDDLGYPDEE